MKPEQMISFVCWFLRSHGPAREWGGLRREAELLVEDYLRGRDE